MNSTGPCLSCMIMRPVLGFRQQNFTLMNTDESLKGENMN